MWQNRYLRYPIALSILLLSSWGPAQPLASAPGDRSGSIAFVCVVREETRSFQLLFALYRDLFAEMGYDFRMDYQPARRALVELSQGHVDGDCGRVWHDGLAALPVVPLNTPIMHLNTFFWTYQTRLTALTPEQALSGAYSVALVRGYLWVERFLALHPHVRAIPVSDTNQALRLLQSGRADLFISPPDFIEESAHLRTGNPLPQQGRLLGREPVYPLLHVSHAELAPLLAEKIRQQLADPNHPLHPR